MTFSLRERSQCQSDKHKMQKKGVSGEFKKKPQIKIGDIPVVPLFTDCRLNSLDDMDTLKSDFM